MLVDSRIKWPIGYEWLHDYTLAKPETVLEYKESWNALLYRLHGKIFALLLHSRAHGILLNLKCEPYLSLYFRERYETVIPGWHMNKLHWISLFLAGSTPEDVCRELVDISYDLVKAGLPGRLKNIS